MASRIDRMPPQDIDAEKYVLGALMIAPSTMLEIATFLRPEHFYRAAHSLYYRVILSLFNAGRPIDTVEVTGELERLGKYQEVGGDEYLTEIHSWAPHSVNAVYHAESIRQKATLRDLITACTEIAQSAYTTDDEVSQVLAAAESRIFALTNDAAGARGPSSSAEVIADARSRIEARKHGFLPGVATGFVDLDEILGGCLSNSTVTILAARPAMGKTAFALGLCEHAALTLDTPALLISLEMAKGEIGERRLAAHTGIGGGRLKTPWTLRHTDWAKIEDSAATLSQAKLWVDDAPTRNLAQIAAIARREKAYRKIGLLAVDYMQLVDGTGENDSRKSRQEVVAQVSRRLKVLAKELDIPVVALSQLNRECEGRADRRPMLSDLRESGAIEQDADVVLLLHRPEYYNPNDEPGIGEVIVAKNRHGADGRVKLTFLKEQARFTNLSNETRLGSCPDFGSSPCF